MPEQLPLQGPLKVRCPCGCGKFGTPRKKAWGDGLRHVKGCGPCRRCQGSRSKSTASARERRIAKQLGGTREPMSGVLSGVDIRVGFWTIEETADESIVRGIRRWWTSKTVRTKMARLLARHGEAHALICSWDGRPQIVVQPYDDWMGEIVARDSKQ